ncbi:MAG: YceI family protein [Arachidicoccus sp.]|nr:YceI family protein [Arachidicoccus sp.]
MKNYKLDPAHSDISFKVRHLLISNVSGKFKAFEGELDRVNDDFSESKVSFLARVESIDTGNEQRDAHLKSADFFDAEKYPEIKFSSTSFEKDGDSYKVVGDLTIHDVTNSIILDVVFNGASADDYGNKRIGFEGKGKINRKDFGLGFTMTTQAGTVVIGDDIKLEFDVQFIEI